MACQVDVVAMISESELKVEQDEVPGTYVFKQRETRDELVLRDDGTFQRSAVYRGIRQAQAGTWRLWNMREETASRIEFDATTPKCPKSTRSSERISRMIRLRPMRTCWACSSRSTRGLP